MMVRTCLKYTLLTVLGFSATLVGVPLFQFLYFGFYYKLKEDLPYKNLIFRDMLASMLSGGVC